MVAEINDEQGMSAQQSFSKSNIRLGARLQIGDIARLHLMRQ
jgi:hypothetical protein